MRRLFFAILALSLCFCATAQKKEISQIKSYIKSGKDLDKAEALLQKVLAMPGQKETLENHYLLSEVVRRQYESKNELLYLKSLTDTASVFPLARKMFAVYEKLDSIDQMPDSKGRVNPKYRKKNSAYLNRFRQNLFFGGVFSMQKQNYSEAFDCIDAYLDCENQPLFSGFDYSLTDSMRQEAACIAVASAHKLKDHRKVVKYSEIALLHLEKATHALVQLHQSYLSVGDTLSAVRYLRNGFERFPDNNYFFPRLVDYYMEHNMLDTVSTIVTTALTHEPGNIFYRMAYNTLLLNTGHYDECIQQGDSLIHTNDHMTNAYFNVGSAYYNKALLVEKSKMSSRTKRKESNALYQKALPYIERYKKMRPKRISQWGQMLYNIYLNLNMGKEFEEIEKILK